MHMLSKQDLHSTELETARVSRNPTHVDAANGAVEADEEATACVKALDEFVTGDSASPRRLVQV